VQLPKDEKTLERLVKTLCDERKAAVGGRRELEVIWQSARDQYRGLDDKNSPRRFEKGATLDSPLTPFQGESDSDRSTVFVNITRPYTNAGTARVADILLPTGKMPWELRPTPVSDLQTVMGTLAKYPELLNTLPMALPPELLQKMQGGEAATVAIEQAGQIIKDWLKESDWGGVVRRQLVEAGKVGTGIVKGPFPKERKVSKDVDSILQALPSITDEATAELLLAELETMLLYTPQIECIKVENCFPDPECGTDVQNGKYFYEKIPEVTRRQLRDMQDDPNYDKAAIQKALDEGPLDETSKHKHGKESKKPFSLWVRTGPVDWKDEEGKEHTLEFCTITLCNDRIIKCAPFPLETERFPYNILCWEPRDESWAGIGIPEQIETPQRGLNAAVRALMDNMGYSVGPQVLELDGLIEPIEGEGHKLHPYKRWRVKSGLPGVDAMTEAKSAMTFLEFPNYLNEIMPVIQYWLKMAEDTTGLSLLLQGQAVTDAVGVSQQLMNNSTTNLRLIVKEWDDRVCRPLLTAFYEWVQLYGPETARGDAVVEPLGSTTLIVKELQQQALLQISQQVLQPVYGVSPQKWMQTYLEGFQIDIEKLALTDEERQRLEAAEQQPDPKVQAAQIEAQAEVYKADLKKQTDELKLALEAQFKQLSLQQAYDAAELQSTTALAQEGMRGQQALEQKEVGAAADLQGKRMDLTADPGKQTPPQTEGQMEEDPQDQDPTLPPAQDVDAALSMLGLE